MLHTRQTLEGWRKKFYLIILGKFLPVCCSGPISTSNTVKYCPLNSEFRHYLSEKAAYNKVNQAAGKEIVEWPMCLSASPLTESRRQELSREKLISKLLFSIQAFTYTCCSKASKVRQLLRNSSDQRPLMSKLWKESSQFKTRTL